MDDILPKKEVFSYAIFLRKTYTSSSENHILEVVKMSTKSIANAFWGCFGWKVLYI